MEDKCLTVAVLSGKGGAGKTLVSVNLACAAQTATYIDCDVEEPNGHLFLKPDRIEYGRVYVKVPEVSVTRCTGCRRCVEFCAFNALAYVNGQWKLFEDVCHACGGCVLVCPENALAERDRCVGTTHCGMDGTVVSLGGELEPGEPSGVAIIRKLLRQVHSFPSPCFIDCPPGSACAVTESIKGADYCVLVAEPTVFGLHNLAMVYELTRLFGLPCGVVVNKAEEDDERAERFCAEKGIPVLARIPYDKDIGTLASEGFVLVRENETHRAMFRALLKRIFEEADREAATDSQR